MKNYEDRQEAKKAKSEKWITECVDFWIDKIDECDLGTDFSEATTNCWRCGYLRKLQKCHIIPKSLGGEDKPENIIPLCLQCHDEMPDVRDKEEVFKWIKSSHGTIYDTFWAEISFEMADCNLDDAFKNVDNPKAKMDFFIERIKFYSGETSSHFGQSSGGSRMKPSTRAWVIKKSFSDTFKTNGTL